ncbi:MAG TPA: tetrahydrofolate dehydrogenase/cyclohydrolase catalytic domain-containing protein, partial [Chloroflexota bacterium]|nr:tetrahydrofolate dehydrogenase/cyclohydrolase catalytic domain-containing protein [Chloroflexota bacterium]
MSATTAQVLDGTALATSIKASLATRIAQLKQHGVTPGLGTILVGDDPASATYVALKHRDSGEVGIASFGKQLPASAKQADLLEVICEFNTDPRIDAFLVQLPLPRGLDEEAALLAVDPNKDVDGL